MISFLVVNWNGGEVFKRSLLSIKTMMENSSHEYEIVIVDNASADLDEDWIKTNIPYAHIHRNKHNAMFAEATNQSIAFSKGELLCIINNDIIFQDACIDKLMAGLAAFQCDLVVPKMRNPDGSVQKSIRNFPTLTNIIYTSTGLHKIDKKKDSWLLGSFNYDKASQVEQPMFSAMLMPRKTWEKVGDMDERFPLLFNDVDWFKRFNNLNLKAYYIPDAVVTHVHGMSVNKNKVKKVYQSTLSMYDYFTKHGNKGFMYRTGVAAVAAFTFMGRLVSELLIKPLR